jgi:hypothetical protein
LPRDVQRRRRIAERCWHVYDLINRYLQPAPEFHEEFLEAAELAVLSGALQAHIAIPPRHSVEIHEEYEMREHELIVAFYSYVLVAEGSRALLRADPLPHHRVDYRRRRLAHFPHHLHDERGRIQSFSGRLEDFLARAAALLGR